MRQLHARLFLCALGLCLPTVVVVVLGVFFLIDRVPDIIRNEQHRVQMVYREQALELKNHPETGFPVVRGKGGAWAKTHMMSPGFWGTVPSGHPLNVGTVPAGQVLVWYLDDKGNCIAKLTEIEEEVNFRFIFWFCGSFVLLLLMGLTGVGVRYFVNYVKSRDDFLAATAHDLTTPLVGLRYTIGKNDAEARNLNERMIRLVDNIKDFLKLGGKRPAPKCEEIDVIACFNEAYALFREDYRELMGGNDVELRFSHGCGGEGAPAPNASAPAPNASAPAPNGGGLTGCGGEGAPAPNEVANPGAKPWGGGALAPAFGDETLVIQILWNLLGNDLKYAAPYGKVWVTVTSDADFVRIAFCDAGKGMTAHERRHAFDRYYRAKTVLESGKGGFGIGLCTAREFAEAMGGSLTVAPNEPHGCVFTLSLPARPLQSV